jgi:hypothetical protein
LACNNKAWIADSGSFTALPPNRNFAVLRAIGSSNGQERAMTRIETESKLTGVATASLLAITTMLGFVLLNGQADAALLDYKFTVTQPLQSLSETFGGPTNPIIFDFVVDSNAPNLSPPDGLYPFGEGYGG